MRDYFGIKLEFDHKQFENTIIDISSNNKGYCCFVDSTLLVMAHRDKSGRLKNILNGAITNSCDGSYYATMASILHRRNLRAYNGPAFFKKFIYYPDKQCFVGNTEDVFLSIKEKIESSGRDTSNLKYIQTPYLSIDKFDYKSLADEINQFGPRYIWVSLGAPKQEEFMFRILPFINKGMLIGVGAALNYFPDKIPAWSIRMNLIWLYRLFVEPKKQVVRCLKIINTSPRVFIEEYKFIRRNNKLSK